MNTATPRTRTILPRLRRWYWKLLYVVVGVAIYYIGGGVPPTDTSRGILRSVLVFLLFLLAARVFRSVDEPGDEPRPWWRMTGAPFAGFVLGVVFGLGAIVFAVSAYGVETVKAVRAFRSQEPIDIVSVVLFAALSVLYLTSSVRLRTMARDARLDAERSQAGEPGPSPRIPNR
jgi:uncharacterized membrane protein YfcA